ncbi:MAG: class I SAM-dependent methyltransferase [Bacteriovoracaceae bacterium]
MLKLQCPLCQDESLTKGKTYQFFQKSFQVLRCQNCDLVFTSPLPSDEELHRYYTSNTGLEFSGYANLKDQIEHYLKNPPDYMERTLSWLLQEITSIKKGLKFLEIGTNLGLFGEIILKNFPVEYYGLELNQEAVSFCQSRGVLNVRSTPFEQKPYPEQSFDYISLFDVFEHLPRPEEFLLLMKSRLNPGGKILLAVPNTNTLEVKVLRFFKRLRGNDIFPRVEPLFHLYGYNEKNLQLLFERHGFKKSSSKTYLYKHYGEAKVPIKFGKFNHSIGRVISWLNFITRNDKLLISFQLKE